MDAQYIVFQDSFSGFKLEHRLGGDVLKEVIQNITEGIGSYIPSQHFMYFIYKKHEQNVPIIGTRFDTYIQEKAVAGKFVDKPRRGTDCHQYALSHRSSSAWFFTDNMFE